MAILEEGGHGRDAHLPDGVLYREEKDDGCCLFAKKNTKGIRDIDMLPFWEQYPGPTWLPLYLRKLQVKRERVSSGK